MKNKRGFTLVELLAVFALLTIILLVSFPNFYKLTDSYKNNYDAATRVMLKNAASMYVNNNIEEVNAYFNNNPNGTLCIPIGKLIAYEYLDSDLKDSSGEQIPKNRCVNVTKSVDANTNVTYNYDALTTNTISSGVDYLPPEIYITSKNNNNYECKQIMYVTQSQINSYSRSNLVQNFIAFVEDKCEVKVKDNVDGTFNPTASILLNENSTRFYITYTAIDTAGNKALPLKIELIISNDNN